MATLVAASAPTGGSNGDYFIDKRPLADHRIDYYGPKANAGGVAQVETATVIGEISASGDAEVVVTAAGMAGSPKTIAVAVLEGDDAEAVAEKIRAALEEDEDVTELFEVGGSGADVVLTKLAPAANDATLNIAIDDDTSEGLTAAPTSTNTTAGVAHTSTWPSTPARVVRDSQLRSGAGAPTDHIGQEGDFYLNTTTGALHGPKASGTWPVAAVAP